MMSGAAAPKAKSSFPPKIAHADGSRLRVLYAEDQATSRVVTTALLERMGLDVDAVEDGELALSLASRAHYDLILLDVEMPVMDGVSAARGIRALGGGKTRTPPILALSAFLADSTEASGWRDAFDHAISKPANGNELRRAIGQALSGRPESIVVAEPMKPGALAAGLQAALPKGVWARFVAMAADEAVHYVNVAEAALASGDDATLRHSLHGLRGLTLNFGAEDAALRVRMLQEGPVDTESMKQLASLVRAWRAGASL